MAGEGFVSLSGQGGRKVRKSVARAAWKIMGLLASVTEHRERLRELGLPTQEIWDQCEAKFPIDKETLELVLKQQYEALKAQKRNWAEGNRVRKRGANQILDESGVRLLDFVKANLDNEKGVYEPAPKARGDLAALVHYRSNRDEFWKLYMGAVLKRASPPDPPAPKGLDLADQATEALLRQGQ